MMTLGEMYDLAVQMAIEADPRPKKEILEGLKEVEKKYKKLTKEEKVGFDLDRLKNPYADSRILTGDLKHKIHCIIAGIDMETPEILLANELNKKGAKIDLILAHHPEGHALQGLGDAMKLQEHVMNAAGVPMNIIEKILAPRIAEVKRALHADNFNRVAMAAELMGFAFACFHTLADNQVYNYLEKNISNKKFKKVKDVIEALVKIPEYKISAEQGNKPEVVSGSPDSYAGKIVAAEMTGGTSGSEKMFEKLEHAGVGTILSMHCGEKHREMAEKHHINVIVAGHMASDSLGMNLLLDEFEKKGVKIIPASGLIRVSRVKKK